MPRVSSSRRHAPAEEPTRELDPDRELNFARTILKDRAFREVPDDEVALIREQIGTGGYLRRGQRVASLFLYLVSEIFLSAWRVAVSALKPKLDLKPGVFVYRMMVDRDYEIAMLAGLVGLTPGSLVLDVSEDHSTLYVHALDCTDPDAERRRIARGFERKLLEALR